MSHIYKGTKPQFKIIDLREEAEAVHPEWVSRIPEGLQSE